ncbi:MAG: hypothetical protein WAN76_16905 [Candidatus Sulfotelmatobacter sp.]
MTLEPIQLTFSLSELPLPFFELPTELAVLTAELIAFGLEPLEAPEDLLALLLVEGDRSFVLGSEKEAGVPSGHEVLGRPVNGSLDLVLSMNAHARAFGLLNSVN